nr:DUF2274 domain-containing protein [Halotalea alkalilenta]
MPKTDSNTVTTSCPAGLRFDLNRYAALQAQTDGEAVDAVMLIPHMPDALIAWGHSFKRLPR